MHTNKKALILLVDDNSQNLQVLGSLLEGAYTTAVAVDGVRALEFVKKRQPDLILLDVMMPGVDGFEVCRRLKAASETREISVIFLTARADMEDIVKGFAVGGVDYVTKPFQKEELLARVRTHITLRHSQKQLEEQNLQLQQEIAERKQAEEELRKAKETAEAASRVKSEFLATMNHELRTPLTSLQGSLGLVIGGVAGQLPEKAASLIEIAHRNSDRLVRLINDILDIEKIEAGKMVFNLQRYDLVALIQQAIEVNQAYAGMFGVSLVFHAPAAGADARVDADRFAQVMANLISNAAKFSHENGSVEVSCRHTKGRIRVAVADHGPGIPEEFRSHLFEKFSQADSSDTRQKGGTGLGLSICKAIVERMHGTIGYATESGAGTTFYVNLPEIPPQPEKHAIDEAREHKTEILICENDADVAHLLQLMLSNAGYQSDIAYTAGEAKSRLAAKTYAAMTLDILLPDEDGISLLRELRQQPATHDLPIVIVSARAREAHGELNGSAVGVVDWLTKPLDEHRLRQAILHATGRAGDRARILHVEKATDIVNVTAVLCGELAHIVRASTLHEARELLRKEPFDLVILDIRLPDGSGYELLGSLNDIARQPVPVLIFSVEEVPREIASWVAAALVKSQTSNEKLLQTIRSLIARDDSQTSSEPYGEYQ